MTTISAGSFQRLVAKLQSALGTKATAGSAQIYSFNNATLNLETDTYESEEIRTSMQLAAGGHSVGRVGGNIGVELGAGAYSEFIRSVLRASAWTTVAPYAAGTDVTCAATTPHFADASGGLLTAGLKVGQIGRWTGFTGGAAANNSKNFLITALTATNMTGIFLNGDAVVAQASSDSVTFTLVGRVALIPASGHARDYWTLALEQSDVTEYEEYLDCALTAMDVKFPVGEIATADFPVMGLDMDFAGSAYFTTPTAIVSGAKLLMVHGASFINGVEQTVMKDISLMIDGGFSRPGGCAGQTREQDVLPGIMKVTGSANLLFADSTLETLYQNKTEVSMVIAIASSDSATAATMTFAMSRVLIDSFVKTRSGNDISVAITFRCLEDTDGGAGTAYDAASITIQDSGVAL